MRSLSPPIRYLYMFAGTVCVVTGVVGIVVPVLPTAPFILLAAACYARSSERLHQALLQHRYFGPMINDWQEHRAMAKKVKIKATLLIAVSFTLTIVFFISQTWLKLVLLTIALILLLFIYRIPVKKE